MEKSVNISQKKQSVFSYTGKEYSAWGWFYRQKAAIFTRALKTRFTRFALVEHRGACAADGLRGAGIMTDIPFDM